MITDMCVWKHVEIVSLYLPESQSTEMQMSFEVYDEQDLVTMPSSHLNHQVR